jgi:hypothetical protein
MVSDHALAFARSILLNAKMRKSEDAKKKGPWLCNRNVS